MEGLGSAAAAAAARRGKALVVGMECVGSAATGLSGSAEVLLLGAGITVAVGSRDLRRPGEEVGDGGRREKAGVRGVVGVPKGELSCIFLSSRNGS